ncbi:hypothetical protein HF078_12545 [Bacillus sp. RO2]|uniref:hypothetical protein n=1 Tax=Bacillus sp. RO2 TaxID=2723913 RepID=UPI00145F5226|nr:hypothetical protein [Bacillus sp. RO2]NMH73913.1 hypothetical protein [Bacillus sp. RO2]
MIQVKESRNAFAVTMQMLGCLGFNHIPLLKQVDVPVLGIVGDAVPVVITKTKEIIEAVPNGEIHIENMLLT